jgi:hypothetical protein
MLKSKLHRLFSAEMRVRVLAIALIAGSLFSMSSVFLGNVQHASADVTTADVKTRATATAYTLSGGGIECIAHIAQDDNYSFPVGEGFPNTTFYDTTGETAGSIMNENPNNPDHVDQSIIDKVKVNPSAAQRIAKFLHDNAGKDTAITYIYFDAKSPSAESLPGSPTGKCLKSSLLFQDPNNGTLFVGFFWDTNSQKAIYQEAVYNPATKTLNFRGKNLEFVPNPDAGHNTGDGTGRTPDEVVSILSSSGMNPLPGTPTGGADPCSDVAPPADVDCNTPSFVDANTITWRKETYSLAKWAGSGDKDKDKHYPKEGMRYYLTRANEITHHQADVTDAKKTAHKLPYLQIKTDGSGGFEDNPSKLPINIDDFDSQTSHEEFFSSLNAVDDTGFWDRHLNWVNYDSQGNELTNKGGSTWTASPSVSNIRKVATSFVEPDRKVIGISLGSVGGVSHVGSEEQNFVVPYIQDPADPKKFVAEKAPQYASGACPNSFPFIMLSEEITPSKTSVPAVWNYPDTECVNLTAAIIVQGAPTGATYEGTIGIDPTNTPIAAGATSCESLSGFLGWLACPVVSSISSGIEATNNLIQDQLRADIPNESQQNLKAVWVRMRDLAYIILVPIMLTMVIGTALNIGPFDAYTVKKALPRMVAGVIFIALSWYICLFFINVTNAVGNGVQGIIEQPFLTTFSQRCPPETGITLACTFDGGVQSAVTGLLTIGPIIAALILVLWFFLGTILLFLTVTFGIIVLRRIFIIALLLVSPLAIIPWIFPANNKLWRAWWDSFSKLLILYPLIMILITMGHVFALIVDQTDAGGIANFMFKIAAYVLPLVFIPAAFKFAGGAFATISGMANDRSKGLFDRQKKSRANKMHQLQNYQAFKKAPRTGARRKINTALGMASNAGQLGVNPNKWKAQLKTNHMAHAIAGSQELMQDKSGVAARVLGDDNFMYAAAVAKDRDQFMKLLADTGRDGESLQNNGADYDKLLEQYGLDALQLAAFDKAAAGGTMFGYKDKNGRTRLSSMAAAQHLAHGDTGLEAYLNGRIRSISTNAGRPDEGLLSHGSAMAISESERTGMLMDYDEATGGFVAVDEMGRRQGADGFTGTVKFDPKKDPEKLAKATARRSFAQSHGSQWMGPSVKDPATQRGLELLKENLDDAFKSGDARKIAESQVKYDEFFKAATTDQKREMLANSVSRQKIKLDKIGGGLSMLPSTMTDKTTAADGTVTYALKADVAEQYRNAENGQIEMSYAEFLAKTRTSKAVGEVSYQFNSEYETEGRGQRPPGGDVGGTLNGLNGQ